MAVRVVHMLSFAGRRDQRLIDTPCSPRGPSECLQVSESTVGKGAGSDSVPVVSPCRRVPPAVFWSRTVRHHETSQWWASQPSTKWMRMPAPPCSPPCTPMASAARTAARGGLAFNESIAHRSSPIAAATAAPTSTPSPAWWFARPTAGSRPRCRPCAASPMVYRRRNWLASWAASG